MYVYSVEITEICSHLFNKKIRESSDFTKEVTKELISRNIFSLGGSKFSQIQHCDEHVLMFPQNFREMNYLVLETECVNSLSYLLI